MLRAPTLKLQRQRAGDAVHLRQGSGAQSPWEDRTTKCSGGAFAGGARSCVGQTDAGGSIPP